MAAPRVVIVGAGPAGVRCAQALVAAGWRPTVVDESRRDGGQIYRRQPEGFTRPARALYGSEAPKAQALHASFDALRPHIDHRSDTLAWHAQPGRLHVVHQGVADVIRWDALVICTGATDRLMPVPGWQLAGCYSLGAAQVALKSQACAVGERLVFAGSGPLLYLVAAQHVKAGAKVAAVLDTAPWQASLRALPDMAARPGVLLKGLGLLATLARHRVPVHRGVRLMAIDGEANTGVHGIRFSTPDGQAHTLACDAVAMGHHLRAESQLADLSGCAFQFDEAAQQWLPQADADGRSSVTGVYLAGDGLRLQGADAAEAAGRLAALAVLQDLGHPVDDGERQRLRDELAVMARFHQGLATAFPWPAEAAAKLSDDTVVCRCEGITAGQLRDTVRGRGACELNRVKAFSRLGMGRCQGRYCGLAGAEVIAHATGLPVADIGRLRAQGPLKPIGMAVQPAPLPTTTTHTAHQEPSA